MWIVRSRSNAINDLVFSVYQVDVLAFSESGLIDLVQKDSRIALILLIVLAATVALFLVSYFLAMLGAARREIELCAKLIKKTRPLDKLRRRV